MEQFARQIDARQRASDKFTRETGETKVWQRTNALIFGTWGAPLVSRRKARIPLAGARAEG
ncbi:MAG TPA: hypothetical protein VGK37_11010 [Casimicrobiaceae bacterium]|jgi:hypothetical protein